MATEHDQSTCARCAELERERDEALMALAKERELSNALRLHAFGPGRGLPPLPDYPVETGPGAPPLRYVVADQLNTAVKKVFGRFHRAGRDLLSRTSGRQG